MESPRPLVLYFVVAWLYTSCKYMHVCASYTKYIGYVCVGHTAAWLSLFCAEPSSLSEELDYGEDIHDIMTPTMVDFINIESNICL